MECHFYHYTTTSDISGYIPTNTYTVQYVNDPSLVIRNRPIGDNVNDCSDLRTLVGRCGKIHSGLFFVNNYDRQHLLYLCWAEAARKTGQNVVFFLLETKIYWYKKKWLSPWKKRSRVYGKQSKMSSSYENLVLWRVWPMARVEEVTPSVHDE